MLRTCIAVVAKGFSEAAFTTAFLYSAELYPTVLRYKPLEGSEASPFNIKCAELMLF